MKVIALPRENGTLYINLEQITRVERYNTGAQEGMLRVFFSDDQYREFTGEEVQVVLDALEAHTWSG